MIKIDDEALGPEISAVLLRVQAQTGIAPGELVSKLLAAQLADLASYSAWLDAIPPEEADLIERGRLLIHSYGPGSLEGDIKTIDPHYRTVGEVMKTGVRHGG